MLLVPSFSTDALPSILFCFIFPLQRYHAYFMEEVDSRMIIAAGLSYKFLHWFQLVFSCLILTTSMKYKKAPSISKHSKGQVHFRVLLLAVKCVEL